MNNEVFAQAQAAYAEKDYARAQELFIRCLQDASNPLLEGEAGLLYHQIGNCLIKQKNVETALQAYNQATLDTSYDAYGSLHYNIGMAYSSLHGYEDAVSHFETALGDKNYDAPYKAHAAMGNALLKLGRSAEAGAAFREAALDERNADPTKALMNLGVCFMALDRPEDAVASYQSALQFPMSNEMRNKLYANLGQACVASGQMQKASQYFQRALADQTYVLSDSASVDYQRAIAALSQGTGTVPPQRAESSNLAGFDEFADDAYAAVKSSSEARSQAVAAQPTQAEIAADNLDRLAANEGFFQVQDQDMDQWNASGKKAHKRRNIGLKILVVLIVIILLALAAAIFAYTRGFGYPTAETVAQEFFANPTETSELLAEGIDVSSAKNMLSSGVADPNAVVDGVNKEMNESVAYVTATTPEGGKVIYEVTLVRDKLSWKVANVEMYFASEH